VFTHRDEKQDALVRVPATALVAAESLRSTSALGCGPPQSPKTEEKMPLVWRVFGGTMLSICALACITVYQQFSNGINDLRRDWAAEHEARADLVKKDELNSRLTPLWTGVKDAHATISEITALKERCTMLQEQLKTAENDRKALGAELQQMRDRLVRLEARQEPRPTAKTED